MAFLRVDAGRHPNDAELARLIKELAAFSEDFRRPWADHTVRDETHGDKPLYHPFTGPLDLSFETFRVPDEPDQALTVYAADPGSAAARGCDSPSPLNSGTPQASCGDLVVAPPTFTRPP